jgi:hypothetical protein
LRSHRAKPTDWAPNHASPGSGTAGSFIQITVSDPIKQNEGINAYIAYKVRRRGWGGPHFTIKA